MVSLWTRVPAYSRAISPPTAFTQMVYLVTFTGGITWGYLKRQTIETPLLSRGPGTTLHRASMT